MKRIAMLALASIASIAWICPPAAAQPAGPAPRSPNILVVVGDGIGWLDLSAYSRGVMGYKTPHIDRLADEGMLFTDYYGRETPAAGRAALLTGRASLRGFGKNAPDLVETLTSLGYASGRFESTSNERNLSSAAMDFIARAHTANVPFFVFVDSPRPHLGHADAVVERDAEVGELLTKLDDLDVAQDTIVVFAAESGGGATPFQSEKKINWEGAYRVPCLIRWPRVVKPGSIVNQIVAAEDWLPTLVAAAGNAGAKAPFSSGLAPNPHLDGYDQTALLSGKGPSARKEFFYANADGRLVALRYEHWKAVFAEEASDTRRLVTLRTPELFDLETDPFERGDDGSIAYRSWRSEHAAAILPALGLTKELSFKDFPPEKWTLETAVRDMQKTDD